MSIVNLVVEALTVLGTGAVVMPHIPDKFKRAGYLFFVVFTVLVLAHDMKDVYYDFFPKPEDVTVQQEKDFFEHHRDSIDGMKQYLAQYPFPKGKYVEDANHRITTLAEEATKKGQELLATGGAKSLNLACQLFKVGADNGIERAKKFFSTCEE